jgi:hypothetical protein
MLEVSWLRTEASGVPEGVLRPDVAAELGVLARVRFDGERDRLLESLEFKPPGIRPCCRLGPGEEWKGGVAFGLPSCAGVLARDDVEGGPLMVDDMTFSYRPPAHGA